MAQQQISVGSRPNRGDGDPLRTAFIKINDNFDELYARDVNTDSQTLTLVGDVLTITGGNSVTLPAVSGAIDVTSIENSAGNLSITADNYVIIDSDNDGQIEIGRNSGVGNVIIGNSANNTEVIFEGTVTTLAVFGNPTLSVNADTIALDAQAGNLVLQTSDRIINNFGSAWEVQGVAASIVLNDDGVLPSELSVNIDVVDFGTGNTIDMQNCSLLLNGTTFTDEPWISLADLKTEVAASADFADFQARIAAL